MDEEKTEIQTDDWREAFAFYILTLKKCNDAAGKVDQAVLEVVLQLLNIAAENGWKFSGEQTLSYCLSESNSPEKVCDLVEALGSGGFLDEQTFDRVASVLWGEEDGE